MCKLVVLHEGRFGEAVAGRIAERVGDVHAAPLTGSLGRLESLLAGAGFVAVPLWRRYAGECDLLDAACARFGVPWSGVVLEDASLVGGPIVSPGRGACYACYRRRWLAHSAVPEREQVIEQAYARDPSLGVPGFLPSVAAIAAAGLLLDRAEHEIAAGRIRRVDLLRCQVEETRTVRVHGCPRCSLGDEPGRRYVSRLIPALKDLLR
jgi:bacteriocin biosynthesis cyclodehydratase domain-containing protein